LNPTCSASQIYLSSKNTAKSCMKDLEVKYKPCQTALPIMYLFLRSFIGGIISVPCNDLTSFVGTQKWKHVRIAKSGSQEFNLLKFPDCMAINWIKIWMDPCKALAASLHKVSNYLSHSYRCTDAQMHRCTDAQMRCFLLTKQS